MNSLLSAHIIKFCHLLHREKGFSSMIYIKKEYRTKLLIDLTIVNL